MTLNRRLATAAAAIVHRMIKRRRPRVLRPVSPVKKGCNPAGIELDGVDVATMIDEAIAMASYGGRSISRLPKDRSCLRLKI